MHNVKIKVRRFVHLKEITNGLLNAFNDAANVTKSYVPAMNAPAMINIPIGQNQNTTAKESAIRQKRGRLIGSKDSASQKMRNGQSSLCTPEDARNALEEAHNAPTEVMVKLVLSRIMKVLDETLEAP